MNDPINPNHYKDGEIECIDAMEASMTPEAFEQTIGVSIC